MYHIIIYHIIILMYIDIFHFVKLTAQLNTWAKHPNVRHFWGVDEQQDYDINCNEKLSAYNGVASLVNTCQSPMGWKPNRAEQFRIRMYARDRIRAGYGPGWFCAQRRPGHALGWLQTIYQSNATSIPDILLLVDDDTSVVRRYLVCMLRLCVKLLSNGMTHKCLVGC